MRLLPALLAIFIFSSTSLYAQKDSLALEKIINKFQKHEPFKRSEYPLGLYTEEHYKKEAEFAEKLLKEIKELDYSQLSESQKISADLLKYDLKNTVKTYEFKAYLNPLLSDSGFHLSLNYQIRDLNNYAQVRAYLNKLNAIPEYVDQHFKLLREGLKEGITQPLIIFEGYENTYNSQIVDNYKDSYFYKPFENLPSTLSEKQKDSVLNAAEQAINKNVIPEFKRIKKFFETEYYPKTKTALGVSEIPNGEEYYDYLLEYYTTLDLSADEVHNIGLDEVQRINTEMKKVMAETGFKGSFSEFFDFLRTDEQFYAETPEELLMFARDIAKRIDAKLPAYFTKLPRKPYGVEEVPSAIAPKYTTGRYIGASDDTQPGYYWVNTYDLPSRPKYVLPSLTAHEAVPGHHLQISLNNELGEEIPEFRRRFYISAFGEGWGLYSEFLAEEMGIYRNPYEVFGKLTYEQWRACRLVVDTGIHAKGWTRDQAVDFMKKNTALSIHEINTEVDRYISWPGQAVSYKIGELKIRELRKKAEEALGADFDIRKFHEVILEEGVVTLPILEKRVMEYIHSKS
ncbi:uncharacterized protein (DUF885 family) [Christiangramia gaetbulicola]|uniref:Uncharacterized protein (DUF885 family) n=1 Tax=Christiangramia gaetbulicola TaxID=703340 RepID=A0A2T6ALA0_9FLAO|nr:DUF885 domain-containing protein [Christiangramia gaetbulicola]PTX44603.1 uncharacterized protein (DUF885 family) [Christiangramia gaetbulicola]